MARQKGRYIPALDGLRAFAVLAVIAYHMNFSWAKGGLLGVTVFFVLSGYLITGLLIVEYRSTGHIDLPHFWLRRVRRLVPAIVTVIVVVAALCTIFNHALLTKMRPDIVPSLFFFSNWWQIFHNVSYFEAIGAPSPLQHFWSLAIEEQFYLVWPPLLFVLLRLNIGKTALRRGVLVAALASTLAMAFFYDPTGDPSRVYYGTDTRAFSLLIGAWLAFVWPAGDLKESAKHKLSGISLVIFDAIGVIALVGVIAMCVLVNGYTAFMYRGGILLCSVLTAIAIAIMAHPASMLGRLMQLPPLVWIGQRSYGMYLWHYPILLLMSDPNATSDPHPLWLVLELFVIFGASAASFALIENPIRRGGLGNWIRLWREGAIDMADWMRTHLIPYALGVVIFATAAIGIALVPDTTALDNMEELQEAADAVQEQIAQEQEEEVAKVYDVILIGDSVSVRTIPFFQETFPQGLIDAAIGRQMNEAADLLTLYHDREQIGGSVILALGANGPVDEAAVQSCLSAIGDGHDVYLVTVRGKEDWCEPNNYVYYAVEETTSNVHVIDWYSLSAGQDSWFDGDGTHLSDEGAKIYVDFLHDAMGYVAPATSDGVGDTAEDIYGIALGGEEHVLDEQN